MTPPIIYWYRQDLRVHDLPGLSAAAATERPIIPCYILDDENPGEWRTGDASRWWLHRSLQSLAKDLSRQGGRLVLRQGEAGDALARLIGETGAQDIYCSRMYEPWASALESRLHRRFDNTGINFKRFGGALLHEPEAISNLSGEPYKVFTPFWRRCQASPDPAAPGALPKTVSWWQESIASDSLEGPLLRHCQTEPAGQWSSYWTPGCAGANEKLEAFLREGVHNYTEGRNYPAMNCTTRLSPHLHYGEISPREIWQRVRFEGATRPELDAHIEKLLSEMGWREFSHHLMHHYPEIVEQPFKARYRHFPWLADDQKLAAWQTGQTGYPIVDAGMRELRQTGYMHNRVRMVVASFLTKHLLIHWREGANWFWNNLLDADLANNSGGWQWVAGSGADASPYYRIFNPVTQGQKFDAEGLYIRRWVPELGSIPDRYLHRPWEASAAILKDVGVRLGRDYPLPVVDHKQAREAALAAYSELAAR